MSNSFEFTTTSCLSPFLLLSSITPCYNVSFIVFAYLFIVNSFLSPDAYAPSF